MLIEVTQKDIDGGHPRSCWSCPIATALVRALKDLDVTVTKKNLYVGSIGKGERKLDLPRQAIRFIRDFDSGYEVAPFSFELEVPDAVR